MIKINSLELDDVKRIRKDLSSMNDIKYVLIVSQYYYSHHCFVVSASEDGYREKALSLIEKLENYKRDDDNERLYHYGTLFRENAYTEISGRWNVNDAGDIYFIPLRFGNGGFAESRGVQYGA